MTYDGALQMFVEPARAPDVAVLGFYRWLVEQGRLESSRTDDGEHEARLAAQCADREAGR